MAALIMGTRGICVVLISSYMDICLGSRYGKDKPDKLIELMLLISGHIASTVSVSVASARVLNITNVSSDSSISTSIIHQYQDNYVSH